MLQGLAINHQLAHFANRHLQVLLMSRVGFFFLEGVQVAGHPGQAAEQAGLALGGRVRGPCSLGYPPVLAHLHSNAVRCVQDELTSTLISRKSLLCCLGLKRQCGIAAC